jgi:predicted DNA repair protein MutK
MAGSSLLALIDDIATLLDDVAILTKVASQKGAAMADDVAVLTKIASQKTAGVLGDDLALNAQQVTGVAADRELPVVWAVAKGSFVNKAILVPAALLISAVAPWAVTPLLMIGGAFLCFEGFEKLAHKFLHSPHEDEEDHARLATALVDPSVDLVAFEKEKIKGAVRTDFILSAEIIAISLGTVATQPFLTQVIVLSLIAVVMTVGVYGFVGAIVKLDDLGLHLGRKEGSGASARLMRGAGSTILGAAPFLMRFLSVAGTAAMFLVGGGILAHGIGPLHHWTEEMSHGPGVVASLGPMVVNGLVGVVAGALILAIITGVSRLRSGSKAAH